MTSENKLIEIKTRFENYISYYIRSKKLDRPSTKDLTKLLKRVQNQKRFSYVDDDFSLLYTDIENPKNLAYVDSILTVYPEFSDLLKAHYKIEKLKHINIIILDTSYRTKVFHNTEGKSVRVFSLADFIGPIESDDFYIYIVLSPNDWNIPPVNSAVHELIHVVNRELNPNIQNILDDGIAKTWSDSILVDFSALDKHRLVDIACNKHQGFDGFLLTKTLLARLADQDSYHQYLADCKAQQKVICDPNLIDSTIREDKTPLSGALKIHTNYILSTFIVSYLMDTGKVSFLEIVALCSYNDLVLLCESKNISMLQMEKDLYAKVKDQF